MQGKALTYIKSKKLWPRIKEKIIRIHCTLIAISAMLLEGQVLDGYLRCSYIKGAQEKSQDIMC